MKHDRPGPAIAADDQRARIVAKQRARHPAEMRERAGDPFAPVILALTEEGFDKEAAGVTEDRDQQEHAHLGAGDRHALLAEIDLQLVARRRFDAHRRELGHPALASKVRHRSLNGPDTDREPRAASKRCTTTAFPPAGPSYSVRASRRRSSVSRRAAGRTWPSASIDCRKYRRTVFRATPTARAIALLADAAIRERANREAPPRLRPPAPPW